MERLWSLWAQSYLAQRANESAELILWEAGRRFPENASLATQLVRLLATNPTRDREAIQLAEQVFERFPHNNVVANVFAYVLLRSDRSDRALDILSTRLQIDPRSDADISLFAMSLSVEWSKRTQDDLLVEDRLLSIPRDNILLGKIGVTLEQQEIGSVRLETYYRTALQILPDDPFLRLKLASALLDLDAEDKIAEALSIMEDIKYEEIDDQSVRAQFERLESRLSSPDPIEPMEESKEGDANTIGAEMDRFEDSTVAPASRQELEDIAPDLPLEVSQFGRLRRIEFRLVAENDDTRDGAVEELERIFRTDPTFAYAQILAVRQGVWDQDSDNLLAFPAAFERALLLKNGDLLQELGARYPRMEALTIAARSLFGDGEAYSALIGLTAAEPGQRSELEQRITKQVAPYIVLLNEVKPSEEPRLQALAALRELNEWAVGGGPYRAAA